MTEFAALHRREVRRPRRRRPWCFRQVGGLEVATTEAAGPTCTASTAGPTSWGIEASSLDPERVRRAAPAARPRSGPRRPATSRPTGWPRRVRAGDGPGAPRHEPRRPVPRRAGGHRHPRPRTAGSPACVTDRGEMPADIVVCCGRVLGPRSARMVGLTVPLAAAGPPVRQDRAARRAPARGPHRPGRGGLLPILRHQDPTSTSASTATGSGIGSYGHRPMPVDLTTLLAPTPPARPCRRCCRSPRTTSPRPGRASADLLPGTRRRQGRGGVQRHLLVHPRRLPAHGRAPRAARLLGRRGGLGDPLGRASPGRWPSGSSTARPTTDVHECDLNRFEDRASWPRTHVEHAARRTSSRSTTSCTRCSRWSGPARCASARSTRGSSSSAPSSSRARGWERPHWYEANAALLELHADRIPERSDWAARYWSPIAARRGAGDPRARGDVRHDPAEAARGQRPGRAAPSCSG